MGIKLRFDRTGAAGSVRDSNREAPFGSSGSLPVTAGLVGRWRASGTSMPDEIGPNNLAAEGTGVTATTAPAGTAAVQTPIGGRLAGGADGLPSGSAVRTMFFVAAFDVGPPAIFAGAQYGTNSANQAFGFCRRDRELGIIAWGANDLFTEWAIVPGQWVVGSVRLAADGTTSIRVNNVEIGSHTNTFGTVLTRLCLGGTVAPTATSSNTTPLKAAELLIYNSALSDANMVSVTDYLTTQHLTGQTTSAITGGSDAWALDVGSEDYYPAPDFTNGVGAFALAINSQDLSPSATLTNLVLTGDPAASGSQVVLRGTDVDGNFADVTLTVGLGAEAPTATDDSASVTEGNSFSVNVIANDAVGDDSSLTVISYTIVSGSAHVTGVAISADGASIEGTANLVSGSQSVVIDYTVENGTGLTDVGRLTLTVLDSASTAPAQMGAGDWTAVALPDADGDTIRFQIVTAPASDETITDYVAYDGTTEYPLGSTTTGTNIDLAGFNPDQLYAMQMFARSAAGDGTPSSDTINVRPTYTMSVAATASEGVFDYTIPYGATVSATIADSGTAHDGTHTGIVTDDLLTGPVFINEPVIEDDNVDLTASVVVEGIWATETAHGTFTRSKDWYWDGVAQGTNGGPTHDYSAATGGTLVTHRETGANDGANDRTATSNSLTR